MLQKPLLRRLPPFEAVCLCALLCCVNSCEALWPYPEAFTPGRSTFCLARHISWRSEQGFSSDILEAGFDRYTEILRDMPLASDPTDPPLGFAFDGDAEERELGGGSDAEVGRRKARRCHVIHTVEVSVTSSDQSLNLETRESYTLEIGRHAIIIQANSVFGALRAMETLAQLVRRRRVQGELEAAVPDDAVWPGMEDEEAGSNAGSSQPAQLQRRRHRHRHRHRTVLLVDEVSVYDSPRFRYRGILIDTARHYLPLSVIKDHLDAMAMVKMNVLHWHLTDDQSFPWQSEELPELSGKGAFAEEAVYTAADIKEVVEYARFRGVRVIPELDTPGHTQSWGHGYPELLTACYNEDGEATGALGPINPARNDTYGYLWRLVREVARNFPDPYLHLGGDEVPFDCWKSNPEVREFMEQKGFGSDYGKLQTYFTEQMVGLAAAAGKAAIVWQDVFDHGVPLPAGTRVQVWKWWKDKGQQGQADSSSSADAAAATAATGGDSSSSSSSSTDADAGISRSLGATAGGSRTAASRRRALQQMAAAQQQGQQRQQEQQHPACHLASGCGSDMADDADAWKDELQAVTSSGYDAILSSPWYLNLGSYSGEEWKAYYAVEPQDYKGTTEQKDRVLGGEACAWGEFIDAVNSVNRVWPRAAAVAERLWSPKGTTDVEGATARLAKLRCRMLSRGIAAQSMGPGFCPGELTAHM